MATDPQELLRRRAVMPLTGLGQPVGVPAPLPILSANMAAPANPSPVASTAPAVAAAPVAAPVTGLGGGAAFGIYPPPSSQFSTNANDAALRRGVSATGPSTFVPAIQPVAPNRFNNLTDPRSLQYTGGSSVPVGMGQPVPGQPAPPPPVPGAAAPAVAGLPGAEGTQPTNASEGALSPVAASPASMAATVAPAAAEPALGSLADTQARLGRLQASNAAVPVGGATTINADFADRNGAFNEGAALRTAAAQGSWSPRRGFQGNDDAVRAATVPIANRARMGEAQLNANTQLTNTATREAGDTARLGMRTAADASQAAITGQRDQQRLELERSGFNLRATGAALDNASKARIEAVQNEIASAKTPEARRVASEKLAALTGKTPQDQFAALELGGGSTIDPTTGVAVPQPKSAIIYNKATGQYQQAGAAPAAAAKAPIAEGSMSTSNGKPIKYVGGKWVPA